MSSPGRPADAYSRATFADAVLATLEACDRPTAGHCAAVAVYAVDIATALGLDAADRSLAYTAGLLHDAGKIGLPPGMLEQRGDLTAADRTVMRQHPEIGERIIGVVEGLAPVAEAVRHHHERFDGTGYPDGLAREAIPLAARIVAVAEAYSAMTSDRPYADAMPSRVARVELRRGALDGQFDPAVVDAFETILADETEEYRLALRSDFAL
jgi:putative nucleotidyltransferase with HDIG domain